MSERLRIIFVILFVAGFIFLNQSFLNYETDSAVIISIVIALISYSVLVLFFKGKHKK